jgi:AcrR family transcriptional regulator
VTDLGDGRAVSTRHQILRGAAHHLARTPYPTVNLDDILEQAGVTKGALYFHFGVQAGIDTRDRRA